MAAKRSVLVVGAHVDECEFCTGGLALMLAERGFRIVFLNTIGNESFWSTVGPKKQKRDVRDAHAAAKVLGAEKILLPYRHHEFTAGDFEAQREVVKVVQSVNPEIAVIHWPRDKWFGHRAAALNSFEALVQSNTFFAHDFKSNLQEMYAFEASNYQTFDFYPDFYIDISDRMDKLVESFSRFTAMGDDIIKGLEKEKKAMGLYRASEGQWYNVRYAEAYKFLKYRSPGIPSILPELLGNRFCMARWPSATHEYGR